MMGTAPEREHLTYVVPFSCSPGLEGATEIPDLLSTGYVALAGIFDVGAPRLRAALLSEDDWHTAPRETEGPYPFGLPYFTRASSPPTLVFPAELSGVFRPRTEMTLPLAVWHELSHAFFLQKETVRVPLWLGEFVPQAAAAAVALREGLPLDRHLAQVEEPGFTVRGFTLPASAGDQMRFQNMLLSFGVAVIREFGDGFLSRLVEALWAEEEVVDEERAETLLATSLGGASGWLGRRGEF